MPDRPHVLLITADHWPGSLLGAAGNSVIRTPTLDQLARCGRRFTQAYTECPVCIPARRTLLSGNSPRTHGDRTFQVDLPLPATPLLAQVFRDAGYQAYAVGKLHVYPPRARAGFDDVLLCEEGRPQLGPTDDYEIYLGEQGLAGEQFLHGMSNNDYVSRPWHLDERHHVTNWTAREMARLIQRRDPTRPGFWYLSFTHPHPPLTPPAAYLDMYRDVDTGAPVVGEWSCQSHQMPKRMNNRLIEFEHFSPTEVREIRRAFYALCTHIDHQIRVVIGTLREEGLLDNTVIMFLSDHGDMLGDHGLWAKRLFYESSARIPMILVGTADDERVGVRQTDDRLVALQDVMPTLLDLAGVDCPDVDGFSMIGPQRRETLYGEYGGGDETTRMLHDGRYKLIYYAAGNRRQLFDLREDPDEQRDLSGSSGHADVLSRLQARLLEELHGEDDSLVKDGELVGLPDFDSVPPPHRGLSLQRGRHWPPPPPSD